MEKDILSIIKDLGEVVIDQLIEQSIVRDIPIVSTLFSISNIINSISDKMLSLKIRAFLSELNNIDESKISEFVKKTQNDQKFNSRVTKQLVFILDKADDEYKSKLIGKLFISFILGEIDEFEFNCATKGINQIHKIDIDYFLGSPSFELYDGGPLLAVGFVGMELVNEDIYHNGKSNSYLNIYITPLGEKIRILLKT